MEISDRVLVCVNLMDEAARKNITIDLKGLSEKAGRTGGRHHCQEKSEALTS